MAPPESVEQPKAKDSQVRRRAWRALPRQRRHFGHAVRARQAAHQQRVLDALEVVARVQQTAAYIRVHGDYHLGQLLLDESDETLHVIDFEGEPQRTLAERRRKTSIFKDLAGMSRSFDYLCHRPENSKTQVKATDLTRAFLSAYTDKAHGQSFYPDTKGEAESLLNAFMLDKAIYELAYEAQHRPDWLDAPLTAVETFLRTGRLLAV